jgi:hypothetical protein
MEVPTGSLTFNLISTVSGKSPPCKGVDTYPGGKVPGGVNFVD